MPARSFPGFAKRSAPSPGAGRVISNVLACRCLAQRRKNRGTDTPSLNSWNSILFSLKHRVATTPFFFVLFLAFAIAAIIWMLLWLFSDGSSEESPSGQAAKAAPAPSPEPKAKPAPEPAPEPEPEPEASPEPEVKAEKPAEGDGDEDFEAASAEEAASLFSSELDSGEVIQDPVYGIIFKEAPAEVDDLKEIKGVAKVLEGKLNGVGVYRFKQVAVWTDAACAEFSKMLTSRTGSTPTTGLPRPKNFTRRNTEKRSSKRFLTPGFPAPRISEIIFKYGLIAGCQLPKWGLYFPSGFRRTPSFPLSFSERIFPQAPYSPYVSDPFIPRAFATAGTLCPRSRHDFLRHSAGQHALGSEAFACEIRFPGN